MRLRSIPIAALAATTVLLAGCSSFRSAAAVVDGQRIDDDRFGRIVSFVFLDPRFGTEELSPDESDQARADLIRQLLTFLIQQEVVDRRAEEAGIEVGAEQVQERLEAQIEQLGGEEAFRGQLERSGASVADVRTLLRAQTVREAVAEDVVAEEISDEALREEYEERRAEFTDVTTAHILVDTRAEAEEILEIATPQNFARLARQRSQDPGSAPQGGDLGENPVTDFVEPFAEAVLGIPVGEIGGPVETDFGFHVVHVTAREEVPFETIRDRLIDERSGTVFLEWLQGRLSEAEVRVNPRYGLFDPASGQVIERNATTPLPGPQITP